MTDFLTTKNKEFIWGLLSDKQMFDGINPKYKIEIQERFEKTSNRNIYTRKKL